MVSFQNVEENISPEKKLKPKVAKSKGKKTGSKNKKLVEEHPTLEDSGYDTVTQQKKTQEKDSGRGLCIKAVVAVDKFKKMKKIKSKIRHGRSDSVTSLATVAIPYRNISHIVRKRRTKRQQRPEKITLKMLRDSSMKKDK